jgi:hypothetical protein
MLDYYSSMEFLCNFQCYHYYCKQYRVGLTHGACSSVALAGFALPECPGSSSRVYPALEGLTAVIHRGLVPPPSRVRSFMCTPVTPAVPYLLLGLQDVQWAMGNSRGARKLARTPHVNQKKKYRVGLT